MNKKLTVLFLAASIFALSALSVSCSKSSDTDESETAPISETQTETVEQTTTLPPEIQPDLPDVDFEGAEYNVLVRYDPSVHYAPWEARDIYAESENSELINDAVYRRNRFVEDEYNCVIKEHKLTDYNGVLKKMMKSGEDLYDLFYANLNDMTSVASLGYFYDLNKTKYIDLDKPWWDQNARKSLSINNALYFCPSDMIIMPNDCTSAIVFNKELIKDYSFEDPYELVKKGEWTIDKLIEMSKDISNDMNGDGVMDYNDKYGYACYRDSSLSIMHSAGGRIAQKDADDLPVLTLDNERSINALNKAFDLMYSPSTFNVHKELDGKMDAIYQYSERMFIESRALFYWILLHDIEQFRDMEADFGILPVPKYDKEQEEYGSTVNQYHGHALAIPATVKDIDKSAIILEALSAKSRYTLQPAYYEISMQRKFTRDEESSEMLDIIFNSRVYDMGAIYNIGGFSWDIIMLTMKNDRNITSLIEKKSLIANKDIQKIVKKYLEIDVQ